MFMKIMDTNEVGELLSPLRLHFRRYPKPAKQRSDRNAKLSKLFAKRSDFDESEAKSISCLFAQFEGLSDTAAHLTACNLRVIAGNVKWILRDGRGASAPKRLYIREES